jgi:hypothetical protein
MDIEGGFVEVRNDRGLCVFDGVSDGAQSRLIIKLLLLVTGGKCLGGGVAGCY